VHGAGHGLNEGSAGVEKGDEEDERGQGMEMRKKPGESVRCSSSSKHVHQPVQGSAQGMCVLRSLPPLPV
jgi:hypothetical protein